MAQFEVGVLLLSESNAALQVEASESSEIVKAEEKSDEEKSMQLDDLESLFWQYGALAITHSRGQGALDILEPDVSQTPLWSNIYLKGLFDSFSTAELMAEAIRQNQALQHGPYSLGVVEILPLADQPWEQAWLAHFKAQCFADQIWVLPKDHQIERQRVESLLKPAQKILLIEPGLAFGTGTHPTTALCLSYIASANLENKSMIDYGCGSGILAVAAALMGASQIWAVDHDPQAIQATQRCAALNGVAKKIDPLLSKSLDDGLKVEIIVANILANPLMALAAEFQRRIIANGWLILSGLLQDHQKTLTDLQGVYSEWFDLRQQQSLDGWLLLVYQRRTVNTN